MSSFACPHQELPGNRCLRVCQECVPGRPGCVLAGKVKFAVPVEERLRERSKPEPPPPAGTACRRPGRSRRQKGA